MPLVAPQEKLKQNRVKKDLENFKSWHTDVMTQSEYNNWKKLLSNKDEYLKIIAKYNQGHIRNNNRYRILKKATENFYSEFNDPKEIEKETKDYFEFLCPEALDAYVKEKGEYPKDPFSFNPYLTKFLKDNPEIKERFYKYNTAFDAPLVVPPEILAQIDAFEKNDALGSIKITQDAREVDKARIDTNRQQVFNTGKVDIRNKNSARKNNLNKSPKTNKTSNNNFKYSPEAIEAILTGSYSELTPDLELKYSKHFGEGLMYILNDKIGETPEENKEIQHERFKIMLKQFDDLNLTSSQRKQLANAIIDEEENDEGLSSEDYVYDHDQLRQYMDNLTESFCIDVPKVKSLTESFLELIGKRLDSNLLKEEDSPADFASGLNNAVTSNSGVDMSAGDTSSTSSNTSSTTSSSSSSIPDFDYTPDSGDSSGGFGGITGPSGFSKDIPDDDENNIPVGEYRVIDVLVNDKDTSKVKVKIQNMDTKETEVVDLSEIDV